MRFCPCKFRTQAKVGVILISTQLLFIYVIYVYNDMTYQPLALPIFLQVFLLLYILLYIFTTIYIFPLLKFRYREISLCSAHLKIADLRETCQTKDRRISSNLKSNFAQFEFQFALHCLEIPVEARLKLHRRSRFPGPAIFQDGGLIIRARNAQHSD